MYCLSVREAIKVLNDNRRLFLNACHSNNKIRKPKYYYLQSSSLSSDNCSSAHLPCKRNELAAAAVLLGYSKLFIFLELNKSLCWCDKKRKSFVHVFLYCTLKNAYKINVHLFLLYYAARDNERGNKFDWTSNVI